MDIPESMQQELGAWNNGAGIDLESWIGCMGNYDLAVGYCTLFWPTFQWIDGYIVREGLTADYLNSWAKKEGATRYSVECLVNHLHIADIHCNEQVTSDKVVALGKVLKEIYTAKLKLQFPEHPCEVQFYIPENKEDIISYQLSFFQIGGENLPAHQISAS